MASFFPSSYIAISSCSQSGHPLPFKWDPGEISKLMLCLRQRIDTGLPYEVYFSIGVVILSIHVQIWPSQQTVPLSFFEQMLIESLYDIPYSRLMGKANEEKGLSQASPCSLQMIVTGEL